jgi:hypothetical protein
MTRSALSALSLLFLSLLPLSHVAASEVTCWFPPDWKEKGAQAQAIATALSAASDVVVKPRVAAS